VIEVLQENLRTAEVFLRCQPQIALGMGVFWQGVTAREIESACHLMHVPYEEEPDVLDGVQHMAQVVAAHMNEKAEQSGSK
jgi:hypothetical protein